MIKARFYLPLKDTDGCDLTAEIEEVRTDHYVRFGGWTFEGYVQGAFQMADGTQALDVSAAHWVFLDELRLAEVEQILQAFKSKTLQEAIYLEIQKDVEIRLIR